MRSAINDNPRVQMIVLGVSAVVLAFLLFNTVLKKEDPPPTPTDPAAAAATDPAAAPAASSDSSIDPATGDAVGAPPVDSAPAPVAPGAGDGLLASKGLPKDVLVAYAKDKAIALLVFDPKSKGSERYVKSAEQLSSNDVAVVPVKVDDVAKYSRITSGVAVSRAPALVVVRPRKLNDSVPVASVSYGYRSPASVKQAINDALYTGGNVPAYP